MSSNARQADRIIYAALKIKFNIKCFTLVKAENSSKDCHKLIRIMKSSIHVDSVDDGLSPSHNSSLGQVWLSLFS